MNPYQNLETLGTNMPTIQGQPMQVPAQMPIQQQQMFQQPLEQASPEVCRIQGNTQGLNRNNKIPKTQSMANMYAVPDTVSGGGSGNAQKQVRKIARGIPKSQSDHNLILMSSNLYKNIEAQDQQKSGGRGTRHK